MAIQFTGNATFDAGVLKLEAARQVTLSQAGLTQAQARAADVTWLAGVIALGVSSGISTVNESTALNAINSSGNP
jgi:hypothetical protein